jgi:N-ethylmaleimide reductase
MTSNSLYAPYDLGPYTLSNRVVMAPLTRNRAGAGNVPNALMAEYYGQRATAGLIISEASQISPQGVGYPSTPGIHSPEQVEGWKKVIKEVHDRGGRIFLQLWHVGRISHPTLQEDGALPVAPSAIQPRGDAFTSDGLKPFVQPRALETAEIPGIIGQYRRAAENALMAGFDGIEVHAANGSLLDQYLRDGTNFRTDGYGGSRLNRSRLLMEVLESVIGIWGAERVGVRLSPVNSFNDMSDSDPEATFGVVIDGLNRFGLAYLHVVEVDMADDAGDTFDWRAFRNAFDGPYMANGGYDRDRAEHSVDSESADLISFGIPFIANPDLPARLAGGAALNKADPDSFYGGDEHGYTDYPALADKAA